MSKSKNGLTFSHSQKAYTFFGEAIEPPKPGTYDPTAWTPPTRRVYVVEFQNDGLWILACNGAQVDSGRHQRASKKRAIELITSYLDRQEKLRSSLT